MTPAHHAVEHGDLPRLRDLLDAGGDVEQVEDGLTLLQHAVDVEVDGHVQTGEPLHVDTTAYLLARGADPLVPGVAGSALELARSSGHWLAVAVITAHLGLRAGAGMDLAAACWHMRRRRRMYLMDDRYATLVAFLTGLSMSDQRMLDGFQEWVSQRLRGCDTNCIWSSLVLS